MVCVNGTLKKLAVCDVADFHKYLSTPQMIVPYLVNRKCFTGICAVSLQCFSEWHCNYYQNYIRVQNSKPQSSKTL